MPPQRIWRIAYDQDDLITRRQAIAAGATREMIRYAISDKGRWQVIVPGIYATFTGPIGEVHELRAAILHGGPGAVITGARACQLIGLTYIPETDKIDVLVPHHRRRNDEAAITLHRTNRMPGPRYWFGADLTDQDAATQIADAHDANGDPLSNGAVRWRIPMAPPARAALDAARFHQLFVVGAHQGNPTANARRQLTQDTRALLCEVVQRRRAHHADLLAELDAAPSAGTNTAQLAMSDIRAGCRSAPECELRDLTRKSKILPEPRWNQPLPGHSARPQIYPDACWAEAMLVVEVNSKEWHRIGKTQEQTEKRYSRYAELGWLVIPVSPYRIRNEPDEVLQQIERAYLAQR